MQDDVVIALVLVVPMQIPVRRLVVYLHISHPQGAPDSDLRIEEVRPGIAIMQARINHFDGITVACL